MAVGCRFSRVARIFLVSDFNRIVVFRSPPLSASVNEGRDWSRRHKCYRHFSTKASETQNTVEMEYRRGLPQMLVPLPTSKQRCLFTLKPLGNTVGDLINMIKAEDSAVGCVSITTRDNIRIASSNKIANLVEENFKLTINDKEYLVQVPDRIEGNDMDRLTEIRCLVQQLYSSLNAGENSVKLLEDYQQELSSLKKQLEPLEKKKLELDRIADRRANVLTWVGLGLMSVQFGILARLTWWEYSWDIMEPVTYFVTYGTAMAAYAYFVLTKQDYLLPDVRDRQHLLSVHKRASKIGLDLNEYNRLKDSVAQIESNLAKIKDPLAGIQVPNVPIKLKDTRPLKEDQKATVSFPAKMKTTLLSLFNPPVKGK